MNRLLGTTLTLSLLPALPLGAQNVGTTLPWSWPWSQKQDRNSRTIVHPSPQTILRRDHAIAEANARSAWQKERVVFEARHRAQLQDYIETRLVLAEENARRRLVWEKEVADSIAGTGPHIHAAGHRTSSLLAASAASAASAWTPGRAEPATSRQQSSPPKSFGERFTHIVRELPKRTDQVLAGDDEIVHRNLAVGLPKGLAVFMALLMLHIPSLAVGSLVAGILLIRGHRTTAGTAFVGAAAILGILIFFVLPW